MANLSLQFTRKTIDIPAGVTLGDWRAKLTKLDGSNALDSNGVDIKNQTGQGPFTFANIPTGDYVGVIERLTDKGEVFGESLQSSPLHVDQPTGEVPATITIALV